MKEHVLYDYDQMRVGHGEKNFIAVCIAIMEIVNASSRSRSSRSINNYIQATHAAY